jgi:hypothetical protein
LPPFKILSALFLLISFLPNASFCQTNPVPEGKQYSKIELQDDFSVLRKKFENNLANLYLYTPKKQLDNLFDSLNQHIMPMTGREFYNYCTTLLPVIKDGHSIILPSKKTTAFNLKYSLHFPFQVYWNDRHLYITKNLSNDTTIKDGTEIISINGQDISAIINYLMERQVRDGYNESFPLWILNNYFGGYYNISFGFPASYLIRFRSSNNSLTEKQVEAVGSDSLVKRNILRYPLRYSEIKKMKGISYQKDSSTAILTINTWDTKTLRKQYHQKFKKEIKKIFFELQKNGTKHLIIDLRDNQGGSTNFGNYLLGFLLDHPYQYTTGLYKVTGHTDTSQVLKSLHATFLKIHQPKKNNFTGKLFMLTNGGSFSNSGIFCSRIEYYHRGSFIGEETGGNKSVISGVYGIGGKTILPHTGIICDRSNYRMIITGLKDNSGHGVVPTYALIPTIDDILRNRDIIMNYTLALIKNDL